MSAPGSVDSPSRPWLPRAFLSFAAALVLVQTFWTLTHIGGDRTTTLVVDVVVLFAALGPALTCLWVAAKGAAPRPAWIFMGLGCLSWALGEVVWTYYEATGREVPFPSLADVGYLGFIPLAATGLLILLPRPTSLVARLRILFDGLLIAASLLFLSWILWLQEIYAASQGTPLENAISLAYPLSDEALATLAFLAASRITPENRRTFLLVGGGLLAFVIADSAFAYLVAIEAYGSGQLTDLGWTLGLLLIGLAGVRAARGAPHAEAELRGTSVAALASINLPIVVALVLAAGVVLRSGELDRFLFWNLLAIGILVVGRQILNQTEDLRTTGEIKTAYAELQRLQEERERLLRNIIHDLNGPLTPLEIQTHILEKAPGLPDDARKSAQILRRNVNLLKMLVSDLQDALKVEANRLAIEPQPADLRDLVRVSVESHADVARQRGIDMKTVLSASLPCRADSGRMQQVMYNLLSNAMKFTPPGGSITVVGGLLDGFARVQVQDSGRGLARDEIPRLFRPFSQVHRPGETRERGTGLGLFICKGILEAHGGRIWVESEGLGRGSVFTFELPLDARPFDIANAPRPESGTPQPPPGL